MRQRAMIGVVFVLGSASALTSAPYSWQPRRPTDVLPDAVSVWDVGAKEQLYVTPR